MTDRLSDERVAYFADPERYSGEGGNALGREVQASRKLIADLRALPYTAIATDLLRQMIDEAGL